MLSRDLSIWAKKLYSLSKKGFKKLFWTFIKMFCLSFIDFFHWGVSPSKIFWSFINFFHFSIPWAFSFNFIYHIFDCLYYFTQYERNLVVFTKIPDSNDPLQHWRKLFYHFQLLVYHQWKMITMLRIAIKMWLILFYESGSNCGSEYGSASCSTN